MRARNGQRAQTDREFSTLSCGQETESALRKRTENPLPYHADKKRKARSENGLRTLYLIMRTRNGKRAQKTDRQSSTLSCGQETESALRKRTENPLPYNAGKKRTARSNGPRILYLIMRTRNGKRAQKTDRESFTSLMRARNGQRAQTDRESSTLSCGQQTGSALSKRTENPFPYTPTALSCSVGLAWYCVLITVQSNAGPMEVK